MTQKEWTERHPTMSLLILVLLTWIVFGTLVFGAERLLEFFR
jgi:preprotein translocase subunit SecE